MSPLLLLLLNSASATTYDVEIAVPSAHPAWISPSVDYGSERVLVQVSHSDVVVPSSHPAITCKVKAGWVSAVFEADDASYPSLPVTGTCTLGSDTMVVTAVPFNPAVDPALNPSVFDANNELTYTKIAGSFDRQTFELPSCSSAYREQTVSAAGLSGVSCQSFQHDGSPHVRVTASKNSTTGTGVCTFTLVDSSTVDITINLSEASI